MSEKKKSKKTKNTVKVIEKRVEKNNSQELELAKLTKELAQEVKGIRNLEIMHSFKHPWKFMAFAFLKGVFVALGGIFGATIVLSLLLYLLGKVEVIPFIGDFIHQIIEQIQSYNQGSI